MHDVVTEQLPRLAGLSPDLVTVGVFSWALLEPSPGLLGRAAELVGYAAADEPLHSVYPSSTGSPT